MCKLACSYLSVYSFHVSDSCRHRRKSRAGGGKGDMSHAEFAVGDGNDVRPPHCKLSQVRDCPVLTRLTSDIMLDL